jgi:hypothetical protein
VTRAQDPTRTILELQHVEPRCAHRLLAPVEQIRPPACVAVNCETKVVIGSKVTGQRRQTRRNQGVLALEILTGDE